MSPPTSVVLDPQGHNAAQKQCSQQQRHRCQDQLQLGVQASEVTGPLLESHLGNRVAQLAAAGGGGGSEITEEGGHRQFSEPWSKDAPGVTSGHRGNEAG